MIIALFADIHGNREALDACLAHARARKAERYIFLGDMIGYGADPAYIVDTVAKYQSEGAVVIRGNHDAAIEDGTEHMNDYAKAAIEWTAGQLDSAQKEWLKDLAMSHEDDNILYVHSEASHPKSWIYVRSPGEAERSMRATDKYVTFCGHVHRPQLYHMAPQKPPLCFIPSANLGIPLSKNHKWLAVLGAVGQPRDEIPLAAYALYDDVKNVLTFQRVPYDIESAANKIKAAGLPGILSARLYIGR